ncbi:wax ester/triacylglycerol synthase family O-acyltransferase [Microlunatus panaciterrae]|nr:wax ester/triacylglycerol synthase family O-acyltransferase [Microlunatus panaciterrae]
MRTSDLERLSSLDLSNLRVEEHGGPMHVAALAILDGGRLLDLNGRVRLDYVRFQVRRRVQWAPRLQQVLFRPGLGLGPPLWVDDPAFDVRYHVRTRMLPPPGDENTLLEVCAELNAAPLKLERPLWELWLLGGLGDGRVAMLLRLHHVMADGIAAMALIRVLFDGDPAEALADRSPHTPRRRPSRRELAQDNLQRKATILRDCLSTTGVSSTLSQLVQQTGQVARILRQTRAPRLSFNRPVGDRRRLVLVRADLAATRASAKALGGTVNDAVLAAVTAAAREVLESRDELRPEMVINASVAIATRLEADQHTGGNRAAVLVIPLPVAEPDPSRRLQQIIRATAAAKLRPPYQPSGRFAQRWMVRVMPRQRLVNLLVSNLAGPQRPLSFLGSRILEMFQIGVVQGNLSVGVSVLSYAGQLNLAVLCDPDIVTDVHLFAAGLSAALQQAEPADSLAQD